MKVMTIVGTRPEIIRLSRVMARLDRTVEHVVVHTGQNYDYELNGIFFEELGIRSPDHFLDVNTSSLGRVMGEILIRAEEVLVEERPDAVLVLGDTNSAISAIIAKRMKIPVYHMEAGNRCFDQNVPEETNRRLVDHVADFNLVYTEHARQNLLAEGLPTRRVIKTGSPMKEVLDHYREGILASRIHATLDLEAGKYLLVSAHREENVDSPKRLESLLDCLVAAQAEFDVPMLVSTHPRTADRLRRLNRDLPKEIRFHKPLGFLDYIKLQVDALCTLSDSGTISEESTILQFPAVTLRDSIERPEALDTGGIMMTGLSESDLITVMREAIHQGPGPENLPADYAIANCADRVVRFILSTAGRHRAWAGIR